MRFSQLDDFKTTMSLKFTGSLRDHTFQNFDFCGTQNFSDFSPVCGLALGHGSRGSTPLHFAAWDAHDSVVERLLEAKAAMDVKDADGRGLGRGFRVQTSLRHRMVGGSGCNVDGSSLQSLLESVGQNLCTSLHQHSVFWSRLCFLHLFVYNPFDIF